MLRRSKTDDVDPTPGGPQRLLVVDDDPDAAETMVRLFAHRGFEAESTDDLDEVVGRLQADGPAVDLVLIDFHSGGTSLGLKLLDRIRSSDDARVARTRAVMATDLDENRVFSWQSGIDGFLVRPYHADELVDEIRAVLARSDDERAEHRQAQIRVGSDARGQRFAGEAS